MPTVIQNWGADETVSPARRSTAASTTVPPAVRRRRAAHACMRLHTSLGVYTTADAAAAMTTP